MICFRPSVLFAMILLYPALVFGDSREAMISAIDDRFEQNREIALSIWELAELGYLEVQSTALLQETLTSEGFRMETGVGDISWSVPTAEFTTATWVPGTPAHSWQAIAAGGTDIGIKGLQLASKTMALTAADIYENPELAIMARAELMDQRGADFNYAPLLGDRAPALDYRLKQ